MRPIDLVRLPTLMAMASGRREVVVGLLDGPVVVSHSDLNSSHIRVLTNGGERGRCARPSSVACRHGTFVAGILVARRGSLAPAICPDCSLLVRPIFTESAAEDELQPSATPEQLAAAIAECVDAGARMLNLSAAMGMPSTRAEQQLRDALDYAMNHNVLVVAAAGNQGTLGSSVITRHPWVIPVVGYSLDERPMAASNLSSSMGRRGLGAPGEGIISLASTGEPLSLAGTSFAAAFVTGTAALLWSQFPDVTAGEVRHALVHSGQQRRTTVTPPLLDAWRAYQMLSATQVGRVAICARSS